ncbi:hypothetical protein [Cellulomonas chitinilytica]|uniref:hypothetical protein n=1 Tax=Cellulomonas chitinilytica TaxID=398759 RepID=UPI001943DD78|nr:hypothetical protein [Cellulomonas chitinilytica]
MLTAACTPSGPSGGDTTTTTAPPTASAPASAAPSPIATAPTPTEPTPTAPVPAGDGGSTRTVDIVVTTSGWQPATGAVEVSAYATGVESGGTCTLDLVGPAGATAQASQAAEPDASSTSCGLLAVPGSRLSSGTWQGTVSYVSPSSSGTVALSPIEVP